MKSKQTDKNLNDKLKLSFWENIFSVKNEKYIFKKRKRVTILGLHFYIYPRVPKLVFDKNLKELETVINIDKSNKYKRTAILASFNKDGLISDYVLYMLKQLKTVVDNIVFVMDNPIDEKELDKIKNLVSVINAKRHGQYDFGSYKFGFLLAEKYQLLEDSDELVVMNDSCYGPINGFELVFDKFKENDADFYGLTKNYEHKEHIQSFFYVFKKNVFLHKNFRKFLLGVKKQPHTGIVVEKYELEFSGYLKSLGFSDYTFVPAVIPEIDKGLNKTKFPWILVKEYNCPIVKVKFFNKWKVDEEYYNQTIDFIKQKKSGTLQYYHF